jgi:hypothetical protein
MNPFWYRVGQALTVVVVGLTVAAAAVETPQYEPFKATLGPYVGDTFVVPVSPPIAGARTTARGEAALLGPITYLDLHTIHFGVDGRPVSFTDGVGVLTAANGDALFISFSGLSRATATTAMAEGPYIVTGGSGRFAGATGSGVRTGVVDRTKNPPEVTVLFEGTISAPKVQ